MTKIAAHHKATKRAVLICAQSGGAKTNCNQPSAYSQIVHHRFCFWLASVQENAQMRFAEKRYLGTRSEKDAVREVGEVNCQLLTDH
jgi:hypothetical protein